MDIGEILKSTGCKIIGDYTNVNGRFIVVKGAPSSTAYAVRKTLVGQFAHVSQVTHDRFDDTWHLQVTTKWPAVTGRGVIHRTSEFGRVTNITFSN